MNHDVGYDDQARLKPEFLRNLARVYLRIQLSGILPPSTAPTPREHLYLIESDLQALSPYADGKVDWLIRVARLICEPLGSGTLFTYREGDPVYWYQREMTESSWAAIEAGDVLEGRIYEYRPHHGTLAKICSSRNQRSITSTLSKSTSKKFRSDLDKRDVCCIVTGQALRLTLTASHLIPKRLGDSNAREIVAAFSGPTFSVSTNLHRFDAMLGVLLNLTVDAYVDRFQMGFWKVPDAVRSAPTVRTLIGSSLRVKENTYQVHNFDENVHSLTVSGADARAFPGPSLHGKRITLSSHDSQLSLPPSGVFDWHYLQCVICRFGTSAYKSSPFTRFRELPFRTADDEDDDTYDSDANDEDPPYPSYQFDRAVSEEVERYWLRQKLEMVARWVVGSYA
jgi:hypothetical protein